MTAEEFIKDYTYGCSNELVGWSDGKEVVAYHEWLTPSQALRAVELKKEEVIEKAVSYLNSKLYDWVRIEHPNPSVSPELIIKQDFIEDFKNYMKGE